MNWNQNKWTETDFADFRNYLLSIQDLPYLEFLRKIIPDVDPAIGIRSPVMKKISKTVQNGNWRSFLAIQPYYYEEKLLLGAMISKLDSLEEMLPYLENYFPYLNNWALVDSLAGNLELFQKEQQKGISILDKWFINPNPFVVRLAFVVLIAFYVNKDYIHFCIKKAVETKYEHYYEKMAVAWLLSVCYIDFPQNVLSVLDGRLDRFTHNKTISKIIDSYRVQEEEKKKIKELRL